MCDPNGLLRPTTTPPPPAHLNKSTHVIYITASAVIVILEPACVITGALPAAEFEGIAKAVQTFTQEGFFFFSFSAMLMALLVAVQGDLIEMCDESGAELCLRGEFTAVSAAREQRCACPACLRR